MPLIDVPDMGTVEFPDSMSLDDIQSELDSHFAKESRRRVDPTTGQDYAPPIPSSPMELAAQNFQAQRNFPKLLAQVPSNSIPDALTATPTPPEFEAPSSITAKGPTYQSDIEARKYGTFAEIPEGQISRMTGIPQVSLESFRRGTVGRGTLGPTQEEEQLGIIPESQPGLIPTLLKTPLPIGFGQAAEVAGGIRALKSLGPFMGEVSQVADRAMLAGFLGQFLSSAPDAWSTFSEAVKRGDWDTAKKTATDFGFGAMYMSLAGKDLLGPTVKLAARGGVRGLRELQEMENAESPHLLLDRVKESIANTDKNDPEYAGLLEQEAQLSGRVDKIKSWESQTQEAAKSMGREAKITDDPLDASGEKIAHPNADGTITINREALRKALEIDAGGNPRRVKNAIEAIIGEEMLHSEIPDEDAESFWKSLTEAQKQEEESRYHFDEGSSDALKGQEAIRRRMQARLRMPITEYNQHFALDRLSAKTDNAIESIVEGLKRAMPTFTGSTQSLKIQGDILNRIERNVKLNKGERYASSQQEAAAVHGNVQPLEAPAEGLPVQESGKGVFQKAQGGMEGRKEVLLKDLPVIKSAPPGSIPADLIVPAIRLINGDVVPGWSDSTHPEIADHYGIKNDEWDRKGFTDGRNFYEREPAAVGTGLPTGRKKGELHSTDLPSKEEAPPTAPTGEAPPTAPATVKAKPGVAAPVEPAISEAKPEVQKGQELGGEQPFAKRTLTPAVRADAEDIKETGKSHGEAMLKHARSGRIAFLPQNKGFLDENGNFLTRSQGADRFEEITGKRPSIPDALTSEDLVDAGLIGRMELDAPFAKRKPSELVKLSEDEFFKLIQSTQDGAGALVRDMAPRVTAEEIPALIAEKKRLEKAINILRDSTMEQMDPNNPPIEAWRKMQLMTLKMQTISELARNGPFATQAVVDALYAKPEELPAARRSKWKGSVSKEQLGLGLGSAYVAPGEQKSDVSGLPIERPAREGETLPPLGPQQIEGIAANMASKPPEFGTRPSRKGAKYPPEQTKKITGFDDFYTYMKNNVGGTVGKTKIEDMWKDAVHEDLLKATPDTLAKWVRAYDLAKKLGLGYDDKGNVVGIPQAPGRDTFQLEPLEVGQKTKSKKKKAEGRETVYRAGKKEVGSEEKWARIVAAVANERLKELAPKADLDRKDVTLEHLDWFNNDTQAGVVRKIDRSEAAHMDSLLEIIRDQARAKNQPVSNTRRLIAVTDGKQVFLLSTYNDGGTQMVVDPIKHGISERPNVPLDAAFLKRYRPISSLLLSEPIKDFKKNFNSVGQYVQEIEKPGLEMDRQRGDIAGEAGDANPIQQKQEEADELAYWQEELRDEASRQEQGLPPSTEVTEGQGGYVRGKEAASVRAAAGITQGEIARSYSEPLTASELSSALGFLETEVNNIRSVDDVRLGIESLKERAKLDLLEQQRRRQSQKQTSSATHLRELEEIAELGKKEKLTTDEALRLKDLKARKWDQLTRAPNPQTWLRGEHRQTISVLQKIADRIHERSYDKETGDYLNTPDQSYEQAIEALAKNILDRKDEADYIQKSLAQFGPRPEVDVSVSEAIKAGQARIAASSSAKGVERELTMRTPPPRMPPNRFPLPRSEPGPMAGLPESMKELPTEPVSAPSFPTIPTTPSEIGGKKFTQEPPGGWGRGKPKEFPFEAAIPEEKVLSTTEKRFRPVKGAKPPPIVEKPFTLEGESPAARRRVSSAQEEYKRASTSLTNALKRHEVRKEIPKTLDSLETSGVIQASETVNSIRMASTDPELKGKAQSKASKDIRKAAISVLATIEKPDLKEAAKAKEFAEKYGLSLLPEPEQQPNPDRIHGLIAKADLGIQRANHLIQSKNPADVWVGRRYLKAAIQLREGAEFARDNWSNPLLHETARSVQRELKLQLEKEHGAGMDTQEWFNYLPGLYEGEVYNKGLLDFGSWSILGRNYRQAKKFSSYYHAIAEGPYLPASYDIADIVGHRVRRGNYVIARREWQSTLKGLPDPVSGQKVAKEPSMSQRERPTIDPETGVQKVNEETGNTETHTEITYMTPDADHVLMDPTTGETKNSFTGTKPIAVRKGYEDMVTSCLARSSVRKYAFGRVALHGTSALKHGWILMLDTFHLGRLSEYAAAACPNIFRMLTGREAPGFGMGYRRGYTAVSYRPEDIPMAVEKGLITKSSADWALETINVNLGRGRSVPMTRHQIAREFINQGLNAGKVADAIYKDVVRDIPIIGPYNKWLFDHFVPGLIAETAVRNFEAMNAKHPNAPVHRLMRDIARDTNAVYGNMGRQGVFRDATLRDMMQIFLLAPGWREGLFQKEVRYMSRLAATAEHGGRLALKKLGADIDPTKGVVQTLTGRQGLPPMGMLGGMMTRGLVTYFILAQVINKITQKQYTWQNEGDHKLDAFVPEGKNGYWLPTLGVFGEIMGDVIRYGETKGNVYSQMAQVGLNSLGPSGKALMVSLTKETPRGEKLTTTGGILRGIGSELAPAPISLSTATRGLAHMIAPGHVAPNEPGAPVQRLMGSFGLRVQPGVDAGTQIHRMASKWADEAGLPKPTIQISATEEDSLSKLRHAIRIGDEGGARRIYNHLIERYDKTPRGKNYEKFSSEDMILRAIDLWSRRPFTGSTQKEEEFRSSMSKAGQELYNRADSQRIEESAQLQEFISRQPSR